MKIPAFACAAAAAMVAAGFAVPAAAQGGRPSQGQAPAEASPPRLWRPAPANLVPFHVAIAYADVEQGQLPPHRCAGVALARNWVLVSAVCVAGGGEDEPETLVQPNEVRVHLGPRVQARSSGIAVNRIVRHPDYNSETTAHDVALIRTTTPLPAAVTPAALPERGAALPQAGTVVGWQEAEDGSRRSLVTLSAPFVAREACQQALRTQRLQEGRQQFDGLAETLGVGAEVAGRAWGMLEAATRIELPASIACAGPPEGYPCDNDSGASLLQVQGATVTVLGVSTRTEACEIAGVPNQFTLVEPYLDWIRATIGQ